MVTSALWKGNKLMSKIFFADRKHLSISADTSNLATVEYVNRTRQRIVAGLIAIALASTAAVPVNIANSQGLVADTVFAERIKQSKADKEAAEALAEKAKQEAIAKEKERKQNAILSYLSTTYKDVSKNALRMIVQWSDEASTKYEVDQMLILAVIAKESHFNPYSKSTGNAEGLMQVITSWHKEKMGSIGGSQNIVEPRYNILKGTEILREYLDLHGRDIVKALQQYNGSLDDPTRSYAGKVLGERKLLVDYVNHSLKTG